MEISQLKSCDRNLSSFPFRSWDVGKKRRHLETKTSVGLVFHAQADIPGDCWQKPTYPWGRRISLVEGGGEGEVWWGAKGANLLGGSWGCYIPRILSPAKILRLKSTESLGMRLKFQTKQTKVCRNITVCVFRKSIRNVLQCLILKLFKNEK